jgi:alkanesulfonate monooxygenase SsuD/methylene tetrahydromethanopterin reductase-like flavin-dependent oxidoreductase (luciferase family)
MQAMQAIWSSEEATFHGRFVNFDRIWSWPKPVQKPRPPVLLGGDYGAAMDRVIKYADEWMPHPDRGEQPLTERLAAFWDLSEQAGRGRLPVTIFGARADAQTLDEYRVAGVSRCVFRLPPAAADEVLPVLRKVASLARSVSS